MNISKPKNGISVVIITYNKKALLMKTIESFLRQSFEPTRFEIIVVDDGSNEECVAEIRDIQLQTSIDILYIYQKDQGFGASKARNRGISAARFERVLFIDSGIIASENLVAIHYEHHKASSRDVVFGLSYGVVEFGMDNFETLTSLISDCSIDEAFKRLSSKSELYDCRYNYFKKISFDLSNVPAAWVVCWGGHVSASTMDLINIGGFDEWFNTWGGEDVELAFRLKKLKLNFKLIPTMETIHLPHQRNAEDQIDHSKRNINYIISKHNDPEVHMLWNSSWEEILDANVSEKLSCSA